MVDKYRRDALELETLLEGEAASLGRDVERFLLKELPRILDRIKAGNLPPLEVAKILNQMETELRSAGLERIFEKLAKSYKKELDLVGKQFKESTGKDLILSGTDITTIETLISFETTAQINNVRTQLDTIRSAIFRQSIAGVRPDINAIVAEAGGATAGQIETEVRTNLAGFQRAITLSKAEEVGADYFLYIGGLIETSRPFCIERDGKVFTADEIATWDNGQGLPADIYLGGYNCRHSLRPISKELAEDLGYI
jgi:hypothetical protein